MWSGHGSLAGELAVRSSQSAAQYLEPSLPSRATSHTSPAFLFFNKRIFGAKGTSENRISCNIIGLGVEETAADNFSVL